MPRNRRLRIATYNIHKARGLDGRIRPERIAEVLEEVEADVVALQEVWSLAGGRPEQHQAEFLAGRLGLDCAVGENRKLRGGVYGNVVLSRFPILHSRNFDLSIGTAERRGCLRVDIDLGAPGSLHVFNIHLGTAYLERRYQARKLVSEQILGRRDLRGRRVVVGDFNEWTRGLATRLLSSQLESADVRLHLGRRRTYPGLFPFMHLDHIYFDRTLRLDRLILHKSRKALVASDHLPLVADLSLEGGRPH